MDAQVFGSDSVLNAVHRGKVYWFWGDTNRPSYPLGLFNVPGAVSDLPSKGALDPEAGVDLDYFTDGKGLAKETARMPGKGPTWLTALVPLTDAAGRERLYASYVKVEPPLKVYARGLAVFDDDKEEFEELSDWDMQAPAFPSGHAFRRTENGVDWIYFANPYPLTRVQASPDHFRRGGLRDVHLLTGRVAPRRPDPGPRRQGPAPLRLAEERPCRRPGGTGQAHRRRQDEAGGGAASAARPRHGQADLRPRGIGLLERLPEALGDDNRPAGGDVVPRRGLVRGGQRAGRAVGLRGEGRHARPLQLLQPETGPNIRSSSSKPSSSRGRTATRFPATPTRRRRYDYNHVLYQLDLSDPRLAVPTPVYDMLSRHHAGDVRRGGAGRRPRKAASRSSPRIGRSTAASPCWPARTA